jgi:hypothetical protein
MWLTFVFLVRFNTWADFITRSNSKLPFWLTGENVSRVKCAVRIAFSEGAVSSFIELGAFWRGVELGGEVKESMKGAAIAPGNGLCCNPALPHASFVSRVLSLPQDTNDKMPYYSEDGGGDLTWELSGKT